MNKKYRQYRQGDVFLQEVPTVPQNTKKCQPEQGKVILAHGEVTGHHHALEADKADWWKQEDGTQFVVPIKKDATLTHQEHGPIILRKRPHRVIRQREYTPQEIRNVAD